MSWFQSAVTKQCLRCARGFRVFSPRLSDLFATCPRCRTQGSQY